MALRKWLAAVGTLALAVSLSACAPQQNSSDSGNSGGSDDAPIRIGVVGASDPYWETYKQAAADAGIPIELVDFTEYTQPNPALSSGDLDMNQFQHILYLANYNVEANDDLTVIGATAIYPMGLYSKKYHSSDAIPQGGKVGVPNDETNRARALLVLQSAEAIKLKDGGSAFSDLTDVDTAASKVEVQELGADLLANSLQDFDAAILNNDFIDDAGLTAADAIAQDDPNDAAALTYANVFAVRADDENDEKLNKLVEIYQTNKDVQQGALDNSGGTAVMLTTPKADLKAQLKKVEDDIRSKG